MLEELETGAPPEEPELVGVAALEDWPVAGEPPLVPVEALEPEEPVLG